MKVQKGILLTTTNRFLSKRMKERQYIPKKKRVKSFVLSFFFLWRVVTWPVKSLRRLLWPGITSLEALGIGYDSIIWSWESYPFPCYLQKSKYLVSSGFSFFLFLVSLFFSSLVYDTRLEGLGHSLNRV